MLHKSSCISPHRQTRFETNSEANLFQRYLEHYEVDINDFEGVTLEKINAIEDLTEVKISIIEVEVDNDQLVGLLLRRNINKHSRSLTLRVITITSVTRRTSTPFSIASAVNVVTNVSASTPTCDVICHFVLKRSRKNSQTLRTKRKKQWSKNFVWNYNS